MAWRFIDDRALTAPFALALEETALLSVLHSGVPIVRIWEWSEDSVTIGRFQSLSGEVDLIQAQRMGVRTVRRMSGGGAVYHGAGDELCISIIMPSESKRHGCAGVCGHVTKMLCSAGVNAEYLPPTTVLCRNRKVSGSSRWLHSGVSLHHATILYSPDRCAMTSLLKALWGPTDSQVPSVAMDVTGVCEHTDLSFKELVAHACSYLHDSLCAEKSFWSTKELGMAKNLEKEKYSSDAWNTRY